MHNLINILLFSLAIQIASFKFKLLNGSLQICQIETGRLKLYKTDFSICGPNIFSAAKWPAVSSSPIIFLTLSARKADI